MKMVQVPLWLNVLVALCNFVQIIRFWKLFKAGIKRALTLLLIWLILGLAALSSAHAGPSAIPWIGSLIYKMRDHVLLIVIVLPLLAECLIRYCARSQFPLHRAAEANRIRRIEKLLRNGLEINTREEFGATPLHLAALNGSIEAIHLLIERGADVRVVDRDNKSPLDYAEAAANHLKQALDTAYNSSDEEGTTKFLVEKFISLLAKRKTSKAGRAILARLLSASELSMVNEERAEREISWVPGLQAHFFAIAVVADGLTAVTVSLLIKSFGPKQVAYRGIIIDTERLLGEIKQALEGDIG